MFFTTTQRYLLYSFVLPFILASFFFSTFLLAIETFKLVSVIVGKGVSFTDICLLFFYSALVLLPTGLPLAAFFSIYYAFNKLGADSEIIAMRSFGMGKRKIFAPFILCSLLILFASLSLTSTVAPYAKQRSMQIIYRLDFETIFASIKNEEFFTEIPGLLFFTERTHTDTGKMDNVFVKIKKEAQAPEQIITAKEAKFIKHVDEIGSIDVLLHFEEGNIVNFDSYGKKLEKVFFATYEYPLLGRHRDSFQTDRIASLSNDQINEAIKVEKDEKRKREMKIEYLTRINNAIEIFNFLWAGLCFGIKSSTSRRSNKMAVWAFASLVSYYAIFFSLVAIGESGLIMPELAIFMPSALFFAFVYFLFRNLDWNS